MELDRRGKERKSRIMTTTERSSFIRYNEKLRFTKISDRWVEGNYAD